MKQDSSAFIYAEEELIFRKINLMKKILFVWLCCVSSTLFAQWQSLPTIPNGANIRQICFVNATTGFAVGLSGTILKTTNGGQSWNTQTSGTNQSLMAVYFLDANTGFVSGSSGTILKTIDGGTTWTNQSLTSSYAYMNIDFGTASTGYCRDNHGSIIKTINGGTTWTFQSSGNGLGSVYDLDFIDANTGYTVGGMNGNIQNTVNGGTNWTNQASGTINDLYACDVVDASRCFAVGDAGTILSTNDGGANWTSQTSGTTASLQDVYFYNATTGWAIGYGGTILHTSNGGNTWSAQTSGTSVNLLQASFVDSNTGWVLGENGVLLTLKNAPLSLTQESKTKNTQVYPNPCRQQLSIDLVNPTTNIEVLDLLGRSQLQLQTLSVKPTVNLSTLPSGSYILRLSFEQDITEQVPFQKLDE